MSPGSAQQLENFSVNFLSVTKADIRSVWDWRSDPLVAERYPIDENIDYQTFRRRLEELLEDDDHVLIKGDVQSARVGIVWLSRIGPSMWELRCQIKPSYSGSLLSGQLILKATAYLTAHHSVKRIEATITRFNLASAYAFIEAGYIVKEDGDFLRCSYSENTVPA